MVEVKSINKTKKESKIKALCTVVINNGILIDGLKVIDAGKGEFVCMPSVKKGEEYKTIVRVIDENLMDEITFAVLNAYNRMK